MVRFTKLQINEICHKLSIVRDEPDLCESYKVTPDEVDVTLQVFMRAEPGVVEFDAKHADMIAEELENCVDIATGNIEFGDMSYLGYRRSMNMAINSIRAARI